jgi:hypothetical protein
MALAEVKYGLRWGERVGILFTGLNPSILA